VTKAIRELEGKIGGPLFVRRKHQGGTIPTSLGLAIKPYFVRAIRSLKRAERIAARLNGHTDEAMQSAD